MDLSRGQKEVVSREERGPRVMRSLAMLLAGALLLLASLAPAEASFPGANGRLYFTSNEGTFLQVYSMESDGGDVLEVATNYLQPSFAPDGRSFAAIGYSTRAGLFVVSANGTSSEFIPEESDGGPSHPSFSPDGTRVAFQAGERRIAIVNLADGAMRWLDIPGIFSELEPSWSPDGKRIAFIGVKVIADGLFDRELYVTSPRGGTAIQLTDGDVVPRRPTWSPDSTMIAFETTNNPAPDVLVVPAAGGDAFNVTESIEGGARDPTWAPDGSRIAYILDMTSIWTIEPNGTNPDEVYPSTGNPLYDIAWQPLCTVVGTAGDDTLQGTAGDDRICGLSGNDHVVGGGGNDSLFGGPGSDDLSGGAGADVVAGGPGSDLVRGGTGSDILAAGLARGNDTLRGGDNADELFTRDLSAGDVADGGAGPDRCRVDASDVKTNC